LINIYQLFIFIEDIGKDVIVDDNSDHRKDKCGH